jgi:hypothetical protein
VAINKIKLKLSRIIDSEGGIITTGSNEEINELFLGELKQLKELCINSKGMPEGTYRVVDCEGGKEDEIRGFKNISDSIEQLIRCFEYDIYLTEGRKLEFRVPINDLDDTVVLDDGAKGQDYKEWFDNDKGAVEQGALARAMVSQGLCVAVSQVTEVEKHSQQLILGILKKALTNIADKQAKSEELLESKKQDPNLKKALTNIADKQAKSEELLESKKQDPNSRSYKLGKLRSEFGYIRNSILRNIFEWYKLDSHRFVGCFRKQGNSKRIIATPQPCEKGLEMYKL